MRKVTCIILCAVMLLSLFNILPISVSAMDDEVKPVGAYVPEIPKIARSAGEERALELAADKLLDGIKGNNFLSSVEKALLVHDRLAAWVDYDYYTYYETEKYDQDSYTRYGALLKHKAVCGGYADAYSYLMNRIGIETIYVGSAKLNHGWNIVLINNKPYYVDVTWDDCHMGYIEHDNFLRSYDGFVETKHIAPDYATSYNGIPINDTTYDHYYWQDSYSEFLLGEYRSEYKIYYYDHITGELKIANDNHRVIYTVPADELLGYDRTTHLCRTNDMLLFSYAGKVYRIDPKNDSVTTNPIIGGLDQLNIGKLEGIIEDEKGGEVDDYTWEMTGSVLTIKGSGKLGNHFRLTENGSLDHYCCLPPGIKTLAQTITIPGRTASITDWLFSGFSGMKSIVIPDGVTSIGDYAFYNCAGLESVTIPDSVKSIGKYAFYNCTGLKILKIGKGVQSVGQYAFYNCNALDELYLSDLAAWWRIDFGDAYYTSPMYYAKKLYLNGKPATDLVIPSGVTCIPDWAFYGIENIKSITIPDSVTGIGDYAFSNDIGLTKITIGKGVRTIGRYAFYNTALDIVDISDLAAWLKISFADSYYSNPMYYAKKLYLNGKLITDLVIPSGVTSIHARAFYGNTNLKSVTIPDSVKSIGEYAFYNCPAMTKITMGKGVTSIGSSAFAYCSVLSDVTISDSVKNIGDYAFSGCYQIPYLFLPAGVTTIGESALPYYCDLYGKKGSAAEEYAQKNNRTFIPIGEDVAGEIGSWKWSMDENFTLTIKGKGKTDDFIEERENGFWYVKNVPWGKQVKKAVIENGVTELGSHLFYNCVGLESLTIAKSVKIIGNSAFSGCTGLTRIVIPDGVTDIGENAFEYCSELTNVTIGNGVKSIGYLAFADCKSLKSITIPANVTEIGWNALGYYYDRGARDYKQVEGFTVYGYPGTEAKRYADNNGFKFIDLSAQPVKLGDANGDGEVDPTDVTIIQRAITVIKVPYSEKQLMCADVDGDSILTIVDATFIQRYCIKIKTPYDIGELK